MGFCNACGAALPEGGRFCPGCGTPVNAVNPTGSGANPPQGVVVNGLVWLEDGAQFEMVGMAPDGASAMMHQFMLWCGFGPDGGSPGLANYSKGSAAARVAIGGMVTREKYSVKVSPSGRGSHVLLQSTMSGFGGGIIGRSRENTGRTSMKNALSQFLSQFG